MKELKLYNTLSRETETFQSIEEGVVKMYSCGPTVYSYPHIGNMRAYVFSDLLKRTLQYAGYNVINAINITDVGHLTSDADDGDDKLEKEAKKQNKNAYDIAKYFENVFFKYLNDLNILEANVYPRATDHIEEQIEMVSVLEEKGFTYITSDGVYFDTSKFESYHEFARLDIEGLNSGHRVESNEEKRNKTDFALWKFSNDGEQRQMEWNSPWGLGFPGWHVECSAMIMKHLGQQIDIHTGGIDHIPIHHTNEIAQTESYTGKKFSNFWLHVNFLQREKKNDSESNDELKMSKSKGNIITVDHLSENGFSPMVLKYYYLTGHYRSELKFNEIILEAAKNTFVRLQEKVNYIRLQDSDNFAYQSLINDFEKHILNDLNTPQMLSHFQEIINGEYSLKDKLEVISFFENITGLNFDITENKIPTEVIKLAEKRLQARNDKNWSLSDKLRDDIFSLGYVVKDNKSNYEIKPK